MLRKTSTTSPGPLLFVVFLDIPAGLPAGDFQLAGFQLLELSGQRPEVGEPELFGIAQGCPQGVPTSWRPERGEGGG